MAHAVAWFEIPANDFRRAKSFYETICGVELQEVPSPDGRQTAMFPSDWQQGEIGGSIAAGEGAVPGAVGTVVFLAASPDLQVVLDRVEGAGGQVLTPKMAIGMEGAGYMAMIMDTEGNRIGLHSMD
jgi:predicted enzyme related to lactoylglutathione lyase